MRTEEQIQAALWDQTNSSVHGKECISCNKILLATQYRRDSSYKEGIRDQCYQCETAPRLSTSEHVHRLRESSYSSEAVRAQRWGKEQLDFIDEEARMGRWRHSSEIISFLKTNIPDLFLLDGNFIGDISIYRTYGTPQPKLDNRTFEYLFYMPIGWMPEHSLIEFDNRDIPVREKSRGWRTVLLRFIKLGLVTESKVREYFGDTFGPGSVNWHRQLYLHRNRE